MTTQAPPSNLLPLNPEQLARLQAATTDFTPTQLAWVSGYFWGVLNQQSGAAVAAPAPAAEVPTITLISASQTGNARRVAEALRREPQLFGDGERMVRRIGWCSGAAQGELSAAAAQGADLYLSGEISERTWHEAREEDVPYLACGHHATECCGIKALGALLAETFPELEVSFYDDRNPV